MTKKAGHLTKQDNGRQWHRVKIKHRLRFLIALSHKNYPLLLHQLNVLEIFLWHFVIEVKRGDLLWHLVLWLVESILFLISNNQTNEKKILLRPFGWNESWFLKKKRPNRRRHPLTTRSQTQLLPRRSRNPPTPPSLSLLRPPPFSNSAAYFSTTSLIVVTIDLPFLDSAGRNVG